MKSLHFLFLTGLACSALAQSTYNQTSVVVSPEDGVTRMTVVSNLAGICAVVRKEKETDKILIVQVLPEGPSEKAGLLPNDYITKIDDKQVDGMDLQSVVGMLRGDPGTTVKVTITRATLSNPVDFTVTREPVRLKEVPSK